MHLYGLHAVCAALENPDRRPGSLFFDQKKEEALRPILEPILERHHNPPPLQATSAQHMGTLVPDGAPTRASCSRPGHWTMPISKLCAPG